MSEFIDNFLFTNKIKNPNKMTCRLPIISIPNAMGITLSRHSVKAHMAQRSEKMFPSFSSFYTNFALFF